MAENGVLNGIPKMRTFRGTYPFGPAFQYTDSSYTEMTDFLSSLEIEDDPGFVILTSDFSDNIESETKILNVIKDYLLSRGGGIGYLSTSLPRDLGIKSLRQTPDVIFDAVLVFRSEVPHVLTFTEQMENQPTRSYNLKLAKMLLRKLRLFVDEDFTFAFGSVSKKDASDNQSFTKVMQGVKKFSTRFALCKYLVMNSLKCDALSRGLVTLLQLKGQNERCSSSAIANSDKPLRIDTGQVRLKRIFRCANG